jgi:hypothetical protein
VGALDVSPPGVVPVVGLAAESLAFGGAEPAVGVLAGGFELASAAVAGDVVGAGAGTAVVVVDVDAVVVPTVAGVDGAWLDDDVDAAAPVALPAVGVDTSVVTVEPEPTPVDGPAVVTTAVLLVCPEKGMARTPPRSRPPPAQIASRAISLLRRRTGADTTAHRGRSDPRDSVIPHEPSSQVGAPCVAVTRGGGRRPRASAAVAAGAR